MKNSEKSLNNIKYSDVKPELGIILNQKKYLLFLDIYHYIRPYLERENNTTKEKLLIKFPSDKKLVNDVWDCVFILKLKWPHEMIGRLF